MTFKMNNIHLSTYYRIRKLIGGGDENMILIEWSLSIWANTKLKIHWKDKDQI